MHGVTCMPIVVPGIACGQSLRRKVGMHCIADVLSTRSRLFHQQLFKCGSLLLLFCVSQAPQSYLLSQTRWV
jgi:hypothetical protein